MSPMKKIITGISAALLIFTLSAAARAEAGRPAAVYMTAAITPQGLVKVYDALGVSPAGKTAVKISIGEPGSNYLKPELIKDLVRKVNGTIVECNVAYGTRRSATPMHYRVAEEHGYTKIAGVDILDGEASMRLPVRGGRHLKYNLVGANFKNYDYYVILSHFKGHAIAGFGGAIKNISIGLGSANGKVLIHSGGRSSVVFGGQKQEDFLESMGETGKSVVESLKGHILYISVMNSLSVDCDCNGSPAEPDMHDIGILASMDPVALDQACVDLVYAAKDGASLIKRMEERNGLHTLEYAEQIGLGSRKYTLVKIDK